MEYICEQIKVLKSIINIHEFYNDELYTSEYIIKNIENENYYNILFHTMDLFYQNENNLNVEYIVENFEKFIYEIKLLIEYLELRTYELGVIFENDIKVDENYYQANEDDCLQDNWLDIDQIATNEDFYDYNISTSGLLNAEIIYTGKIRNKEKTDY